MQLLLQTAQDLPVRYDVAIHGTHMFAPAFPFRLGVSLYNLLLPYLIDLSFSFRIFDTAEIRHIFITRFL